MRKFICVKLATFLFLQVCTSFVVYGGKRNHNHIYKKGISRKYKNPEMYHSCKTKSKEKRRRSKERSRIEHASIRNKEERAHKERIRVGGMCIKPQGKNKKRITGCRSGCAKELLGGALIYSLLNGVDSRVCDHCRISCFGEPQCCDIVMEKGRFIPGLYWCVDDPFCTTPLPNKRALHGESELFNLDETMAVCIGETTDSLICFEDENLKGTAYQVKLGSGLTIAAGSFIGLIAVLNFLLMGILFKKYSASKRMLKSK